MGWPIKIDAALEQTKEISGSIMKWQEVEQNLILWTEDIELMTNPSLELSST